MLKETAVMTSESSFGSITRLKRGDRVVVRYNGKEYPSTVVDIWSYDGKEDQNVPAPWYIDSDDGVMKRWLTNRDNVRLAHELSLLLLC